MDRNRPWHYIALIPLTIGLFFYLAWYSGWTADSMRLGIQDSPALSPTLVAVGGGLFIILGLSVVSGLILLLSLILRRMMGLMQSGKSVAVSGVLRPDQRLGWTSAAVPAEPAARPYRSRLSRWIREQHDPVKTSGVLTVDIGER